MKRRSFAVPLTLAVVAGMQAPIIMMSQNRQAARDRLEAEVDHEVNVRAEMSIRHLDERIHDVERRLLELSSVLERRLPDPGASHE